MSTTAWVIAVLVSFALLSMGSIGLMGTGQAVAQEDAEHLSDVEVSDAVEDALANDPGVFAPVIDVSTTGGIVTLEGTVDNLLASRRAADVAATVRGVRSVVNEIEVGAIDRPDPDVSADIREALLVNPATESMEVTVRVSDGWVTLTGTADSNQERELVETIAAGVAGVLAVDNDMTVDVSATRSDFEVEQEIEAALRWHRLIDSELIDVTVDAGAVTLTGTVDSAAERSMAVSEAWVPGVRSVAAQNLNVVGWEQADQHRESIYVDRTDEQVSEAVSHALRLSPEVPEDQVSVDADSGTVTLRGRVDNLRSRMEAERIAEHTVGVWWVENRLRVRPEAAAIDEALESEVVEALERDPYVESYTIDVSVRNGVATLRGGVHTTFEKARAEFAAAGVVGIKDVINRLAIDGEAIVLHDSPYVDDWVVTGFDWYTYDPAPLTLSDEELEMQIEDELVWSPYVDANDVTVDVEAGVARLTGTVDTWLERQRAEANAREQGVLRVDNDLFVSTGPNLMGDR